MVIHEMYPYICVRDADKAIDFYVRAFGAREKFRLAEPGGRVGHAELDFGGMTLMLSEAFPEIGRLPPDPDGPSSFTLHLHVDNADEVVDAAVKAGAVLEQAPQDHFYGERSGSIRDPDGHRWLIGHSIEEVSPEEMQRRYDKAFE
jgi:uncharacterized glyoxalase superfamily protein PhnB